MQTITPEVRRHNVPKLQVGESAVWSDGEQALYFVDIMAPRLFRLDPSNDAIQSWPMPESIGSFGLCADGRAIVALRNGVHLFDFATGRLDFLVDPEPGLPSNRLNDGKVGPDGRFWIGSMDDRTEKQPVAGLYCIDRDGTCTKALDGLTISNGLAWSPDGRTLYHSDTRQLFIQTFAYNLEYGSIGAGRVLCTMGNEQGRPDGAAMDSQGCYWSAGVSAGCINRISPEGEILQRIELPTPSPTMPCFGGPDLKTLFVTSLRTDRRGDDEWGTLISFPVDVAGAPIGRFGERLERT